ncbi:MAG: HAMP domain-containing histidine kinase, partial [Planctomycetales bacterium]|nr:HAMP domain-containing histidine kinase [Planctomycetales bacterium]
ADRLSHLVENVLAYARLERGRKGGRRQHITVDNLLDRVAPRLGDRSQQAEMSLCVEADAAARDVVLDTDPQAVEQILFNLVDNACKYAQTSADRRIWLRAGVASGRGVLEVADEGPGISADFAAKLFQPFSKSAEQAAVSAPGVGLGLALCRRLAREIGGELRWQGGAPAGATFALSLPLADQSSDESRAAN